MTIRRSKDLPRDENNKPIQAGTSIPDVFTVAIGTSAFVAVALPAGVDCKSLVLKTRSAETWLLATSASPGENYQTITGPLSLSIVAFAGDIICYAKGTAIGVLEVLAVN